MVDMLLQYPEKVDKVVVMGWDSISEGCGFKS